MVIRKVIIPAAGLGTRLFPATKEQPKEMLPIFSNCSYMVEMSVKPVVQMVFEQLYDAGLREFCYVVGRGKRGIEDHFTPDAKLYQKISKEWAKTVKRQIWRIFIKNLNTSTIMWVNQPEPKGFGNAVLMAQPFVQNEQCLVHAGDSCIISKDMDYIKELLDAYERFNADAAFITWKLRTQSNTA